MKNIRRGFAAICLAFALPALVPAFAQENVAVVTIEERGKVFAVQEALSKAVLSGDRDAAAATFQGVGHVGNIVGKTAYPDIHFSPEREFTTFAGRDLTVLAAGDAYVLLGKLSVVNAKSGDGERVYAMTATVAPDTAGDLKIVTWQETFITDEKF